jgi:hypothetical protein
MMVENRNVGHHKLRNNQQKQLAKEFISLPTVGNDFLIMGGAKADRLGPREK